MKEFTVFWGCTIPARFPFLEKSTRLVLEGFNLPYREIDGFTCCPEKSLVNNIDHGLWLLTAARNIALADSFGLDIVSPCTGCISNLSTVNGELKINPGKEKEVNDILKEIGRRYLGRVKLNHLVPFFHDEVGVMKIKTKIKRDFKGLSFAIHYGCHMMRPSNSLKNDDPLEPKKFDAIVAILGGESVKYTMKLACCGQSLDRIDQHENALNMARLKLKELKELKVDAMVLCCPSCFLQFDNNQFLMEREGERFDIPILYFTELMGLSMGYGPQELGIENHRIDAGEFIKKWAALSEKPTRDIVSAELKGENIFTI